MSESNEPVPSLLPVDLAAARADAETGLETRLLNPADRECSPDVYVNPLAATLAAHVRSLCSEVERLTGCLERANAQTEHFERQWYLRGDALEAERAKVAILRGAADDNELMQNPSVQLLVERAKSAELLLAAERAKAAENYRCFCQMEEAFRTTVAELDVERAKVASLETELTGERKAKELALKGLESVTELYDGKKHECRDLAAKVADYVIDNQRLRAELAAALEETQS